HVVRIPKVLPQAMRVLNWRRYGACGPPQIPARLQSDQPGEVGPVVSRDLAARDGELAREFTACCRQRTGDRAGCTGLRPTTSVLSWSEAVHGVRAERRVRVRRLHSGHRSPAG